MRWLLYSDNKVRHLIINEINEGTDNLKDLMSKLKLTTDTVTRRNFYYLLSDGYVHAEVKEMPFTCELTHKGTTALLSDYFMKEHRKIKWTRILNISITVTNVAVAIAAIAALSYQSDSRDESKPIQEIQTRLQQLEQSILPKEKSDTTIRYDTSKHE
jgi:hypothetical protein